MKAKKLHTNLFVIPISKTAALSRHIILMVLCLTGAIATAQPNWGHAVKGIIAKAPLKAPTGWVEQLTNGDCEGTDVSCFFSRNGDIGKDDPSTITNGIGYGGSRGISVHAIADATDDWVSQFFIYTPNHTWYAGERYRLEFKVRAKRATTIKFEAHNAPAEYIFYSMACSSYDVTTQWQTFTYEGTISAEQAGDSGMKTIAFDLNVLRGVDNDFYFDDLSWMSKEEEIVVVNDWKEQVYNGNFESSDVSCFYARTLGLSNGRPEIESGIGYNGSRGVRVQSVSNATNDWDSQFFVTTPHHIWKAGDKYYLEFKVKAEKAATISLQSQYAVGEYIWYIMAANDYSVTTKWQTFSYEGTISADQAGEKGMYTIAFDLNLQHDKSNTYYFDDVSWKSYEEVENPPETGFTYKKFEENTVLLTTVDNIENEKQKLNWIDGGTYKAAKKGTINPVNGQEGSGIVTEGILLKNGNYEKYLDTYVTGIQGIWAYGCTAGGSDRDLVVQVFDRYDNWVKEVRATSSNYKSAVAKVDGLSPNQSYKIVYTGCEVNNDSGTDVVLHGIRFIKTNVDNITFADAEVKRICVANWDTNKDGELSKTEAAAVKDLGSVFKNNSNIKTFNELQYFTGLKTIGEEAFSFCGALTSIIIPNSVTSIGKLAFRNCNELKSITIPNSVTSLKYGAFFCCQGLTSIIIPSSVTSIEERVLEQCQELTSIKVDSNNKYYDSRDNCNAIIKTSTKTLIVGCKGTTIPNTVTSIGENAFSYCSGLTSITIPNSVTNIGNDAFSDCIGLTTITIPNSVTYLGARAFWGCEALKSVNIPSSVTTIGYSTFYCCRALTSVTIPNSVTSIEGAAFGGCSSLTTITIPKSVKSIGDEAFTWCPGLKEIHSLIEQPFAINENVFRNENQFSTATLYVPYGTKAKYQATEGWKKFTKIVEMEAPVKNITFADAEVKKVCVANWDTNKDGELSEAEAAAVKDLGEVFISNTAIQSFNELQYFTGLKSIGDDTFYGCTGMTSVIIPKSVESIGEYAFYGCVSLTAITIPQSVITIKDYAFGFCRSLTAITVESGNAVFDSRNNCNAIIETSKNHLIVGCQSTVIPKTVKSIGNAAFYGCVYLTSISIPSSVTSIEGYPFLACNRIESIVVENGNTVYDSRDNCNAIIETKTNSLFIGCKNTEIPNTVTSIKGFAFAFCTELTSITIPGSITAIDPYAFYYCEGLKEVYSQIEQPFAIDESVFQNDDNTFTTATLFVPFSTKAKYQATDGWKSFTNIVEMEAPVKNITFADAEVKRICVQKWDTNGDSELSMEEAAAVTNLGMAFTRNTSIQSFNELQYFTGLTSIGMVAFSECTNLTAVTLPSTVTSIGEGAFYSTNLTAITIPNSVTSIESTAFAGCISLTTITIPNSVTSIGDYAFYYCLGLTDLTIPSSVTRIGTAAFSTCPAISSIDVESNNKYYDSRDNCNAIIETSTNTLIIGCQNTVIPSTVTGIASYAFDACIELITITIPKNVTRIGKGAFSSCYGLTSIKVEEGNNYYDSRESCNAIIETPTNTLITGCQHTVIPNSVTSIKEEAFYGCITLSSITIPNSVTSIGEYAFFGCTSLKEVHSQIQQPFAINKNVFQNYDNGATLFSFATLYVPYGTKAKYQATEGWEDFITILEEEETSKAIIFADAEVKRICLLHWDTNNNGELSEAEAATVTDLGTAFEGNKIIRTFHELQYFTNLTVIRNYTFQGCSNLTEITIPATVTSVGEEAFNDAGLLSLIWESSAQLTTEQVERLKNARSNILIFVKDESVIPNRNIDNVVVNGVAESLVLTENSPFFCAQTFTAQNASFTHRFTMETIKGTSAGWETIALPFDVQAYKHETRGEITPFLNFTTGSSYRPFWLYELTGNGFVKARTIEANKPYLISMPNNPAYYDDYCLNGKVQFAATRVTIKRTDEAEMKTVSYDGLMLKPTFTAQEQSSTVYAINATSDFSTATGGETAGSLFIRDLRTVRPFEAYFDSGSASAREFITIPFADDTATCIDATFRSAEGCLEGKNVQRSTFNVYTLSGQLVYSGSSEGLNSAKKRLSPGVYLINGKKTIIP